MDSSAASSAITYVVAEGIATLCLNRPEARNGYTLTLTQELEHALSAGYWQEPPGRCPKTIFGLNKPVIAALRGVSVGGGITITPPCDFRLASHDSRLSFPFSRRGILPEGASVWYLPRLKGISRATDWMLTGRLFGAQEALDAGLVTALDSKLIAGLPGHDDAVEGLTSFLEKRPPRFPLQVPQDLPPWLPWLEAGQTP